MENFISCACSVFFHISEIPIPEESLNFLKRKNISFKKKKDLAKRFGKHCSTSMISVQKFLIWAN